MEEDKEAIFIKREIKRKRKMEDGGTNFFFLRVRNLNVGR